VEQAVAQATMGFPLVPSIPLDWAFANQGTEGTNGTLRETHVDYVAGSWRAVAQIHNTYILAQTPDGMVIVDQHAAQEQIFYERLTTESSEQLAVGSEQSAPRPSQFGQIQLMISESSLLFAHLDEYHSLGIDLESFGQNTFRILSLPAFVSLPANDLMTALLQEHERYRALDGDALRDKLAAKAACISAIKAGDALDLAQQQTLLDELLQIYSPSTCPHGRPTFIQLRLEELDRRFLRR
jgi:DNA mismatch repair protein MutL